MSERCTFRRACDLGHARACGELGTVYSKRGDFVRARALQEKACAEGAMLACMNLGSKLQHGIGGARDPKRAQELYEMSCDAGVQPGCFSLAQQLASGDGVPKDTARARDIYTKLCQAEDTFACDNLGELGSP